MINKLTNIEGIMTAYELMEVFGEDTSTVVMDLYKILVNDGYLPEEIANKSVLADILAIDYDYEFVLDFLEEEFIKELSVVAELDMLTPDELLNMILELALLELILE